MLTEVMRYYGLARPPIDAGFFETDHHTQVLRDVRAAILGGRLIALTAIIGSGKTILSRRLRAELEHTYLLRQQHLRLVRGASFELPAAALKHLQHSGAGEPANVGAVHKTRIFIAELAGGQADLHAPVLEVGQKDQQAAVGIDRVTDVAQQPPGFAQTLQAVTQNPTIAGEQIVPQHRIDRLDIT